MKARALLLLFLVLVPRVSFAQLACPSGYYLSAIGGNYNCVADIGASNGVDNGGLGCGTGGGLPFCGESGSSSGGGGSSSSSSGGGSTVTPSSGLASFASTSFGGVMSGFASWLKGVLLFIPQWCWQEILKAFAALIAAIPVPDAFTTWAHGIGGISATAIWWLNVFQFKAGLQMVMGAYLARWLLRRLPFVG